MAFHFFLCCEEMKGDPALTDTSLAVRSARQSYVDALIRTAANLSKRRECIARCAADEGKSYGETLASAAARLATRHGAR